MAALDRGERRVASSAVDGELGRGRQRVRRRRSSLYFRLRKVEPIEVGPVSRSTTRSRSSGLRRPRRARRAAGRGALRLVPLRGRRADAGLREHRRLGRPANDGRHLGDGRLVRADRRRRPPLGRRRHRRRARAAAGAPGHRSRTGPSSARARSSSRASASGRARCSRRTSSSRVGPDHRRHRPGAGRVPRRRAAALGRPSRRRARRTFPAGSTGCRAR